MLKPRWEVFNKPKPLVGHLFTYTAIRPYPTRHMISWREFVMYHEEDLK